MSGMIIYGKYESVEAAGSGEMINKEIRAVYTEDTIRVYQAYNKYIASEAVQNGTFGEKFKIDRMTWIKPSFFMDDVSMWLGNKRKSGTYSCN